MKYIKPETTYTTVGLLNIILTSNNKVEEGLGDPSKRGGDMGDDYIFMSKHESFGFGDSDDSFNDTWDQ